MSRRTTPTPHRWRSLLAAKDAELAELLVRTALGLRTDRARLTQWAALAGLPEGEVIASPFGARMIALGLEAGATTVRHEARPLFAWHRTVRPAGATKDPLHGVWHGGALRTGKYEEFCQEDPFCTYHPEHGAKWAPHEMLHRAVGFHAPLHAGGFTRYVAARLNELLPVATWYGLEHALRLDREGAFDRALEGRELDAPLERARWLHDDERSLRRRARKAAPLVRWTLTRTASELAAIDDELATGTLVPSRDAGVESFAGVRLDASADAIAYVHAHERRLATPAIARVHETLSLGHLESIAALRARVEDVLDRLLFARLAPSPPAVERAIAHDVLHDLLARAALARPIDDATHRRFVARARAMSRRGVIPPQALASFAADLAASLSPTLGERRARDVTSLGLSHPLASLDTRALGRGVSHVVPRTAQWLGARGVRVVVDRLASGAPSRGHLAHRISGAIAVDDAPLAELARFEAMLDAPIETDARDAWAIPLVGAPDGARVCTRRGVRIERFDADVLALHRGEAGEARITWVAVGHANDELVLAELPEEIARVLTSASSHDLVSLRRALDPGTLATLASIGLVIVIVADR